MAIFFPREKEFTMEIIKKKKIKKVEINRNKDIVIRWSVSVIC